MDAYECNAATKIEIDDPLAKSQNFIVTVCIESKFNDIVVGGINELTLAHSSLTSNAIDDSNPNSITEVSSTGTKKVAVSTRLIGAFFTNLGDEQSEIAIGGIAVLKFGSSGARKLVRIGIKPGANQQKAIDRMLREEEDPLGEFTVSVSISAKIEDTMSASPQMKKVLAALSTAIVGSLGVLEDCSYCRTKRDNENL